MKKTSKENITVSDTIAKVLGITFKNEEFSLGKWGEVDNWCELSPYTYLLLECERTQKHPNTNVLKLYPYLEIHSDIKIILIHYFYSENKAPKNRLALCEFIAEKMTKNFEGQFQYISLKCSKSEIVKNVKEHKKVVLLF